jgi:hypothetical protein
MVNEALTDRLGVAILKELQVLRPSAADDGRVFDAHEQPATYILAPSDAASVWPTSTAASMVAAM